jgi:hypothetical protein
MKGGEILEGVGGGEVDYQRGKWCWEVENADALVAFFASDKRLNSSRWPIFPGIKKFTVIILWNS